MVDKGDDWFAVDVSAETCRARPATCGARGQGSTSSARCASVTNSAAISSPAMSMRSAKSSALPRRRFDADWRQRSARPRRDDCGKGLDCPRRRLADRQRRPRCRGRDDPFLGQHHSAYGAAHDASATSRQANSSMSRLTPSRAIFRADAGRSLTIGTALFLLFITLQCDIWRS